MTKRPTEQPLSTLGSPVPTTPSSHVSSLAGTPAAAAQSTDFGGLSPIVPIALFAPNDEGNTSEEENSLNDVVAVLFPNDDEEGTLEAPGTPTQAAQASEWHTPETTVTFSMNAHLHSIPFPALEGLPLAGISLGSPFSPISGRSNPAYSSSNDSGDWS